MISSRDFPGASQNFAAVTIQPSFSTWASALESSNGLPAGTLTNANADYDKDGRSNLLEYAFGGSPLGGSDPPERLPVTSVTATKLVLRYQVDTSLGDLVITPQACPTMSNWKKPGDASAPSEFVDQAISTNGNIQTREASIPLGSGNCFLRIKVTQQ